MLCNTASIYPNGVDKMIFFQDNDLEKMETINEYENLISQGNYTEASNYIDQQEGIYGYFADFFNALENKVYHLQEYLLSRPPKQQPFVYYNELKNKVTSELHVFDDLNEEEEPPDQLLKGNDTIWI